MRVIWWRLFTTLTLAAASFLTAWTLSTSTAWTERYRWVLWPAAALFITGAVFTSMRQVLYRPPPLGDLHVIVGGSTTFHASRTDDYSSEALQVASREIEREELEFAQEMLLDNTPINLEREELVPAAAGAVRALTDIFLALGPPGQMAGGQSSKIGGPRGGVDLGPRD
jgi:hypothetical protein